MRNYVRMLGLWAFCLGMMTCHSQNKKRNVSARDKSVPYVIVKSEGTIEDEPKCPAQLQIVRNDSVLVQTRIGIEYRGAISQWSDNKSYGFECRSSDNKEVKLGLLGMPADESWILYGPFNDRSLLRNALAYTISRQIGRYAARFEFVELEVNGDYLGLYLLMEKLTRNPARINIQKLEKSDTTLDKISGGYVLKIDKTAGGDSDGFSDYNATNSFLSKFDSRGRQSKQSNIHFLYEYPKSKKITQAQKTYIQQYIHQTEASLIEIQNDQENTNYTKYIDIDTFIDYFILIELMQNNDGYRISTFLQKDRNGKLAMGPIWDFDLAFGPEQVFCGGMARHAWVYRYNQYCGGDGWLVPFWWGQLLKDKNFKQKLVSRWKKLRLSVLSDTQMEQTIQQLAGYLQTKGIVDRNYERWSDKKQESYQKRHQKHVNQILDWTKKHSQWIDNEIDKI
jgi:CotH kinase protein